jgi:dTDP-4-dehydrorhamnose 3,5-epimerase
VIVTPTKIPGVLVFQPKVHGDERGFFLETFHSEKYAQAGVAGPFVQDNLSKSKRGVLRGLHFQWPLPQGKLVTVLEGEVLDVVVDIRKGSPTFGQHVREVLSGAEKKQIYAPEGCAHGFLVLSEFAIFSYKCTNLYAPQNEHTLLWNDPELGINWGIQNPMLSEKDKVGLKLRDLK